MSNLTRREFIKTTSLAALAMTMPVEVFAADNCTVKTRYGTFKGFVDENGVKTWLGIPYAQPPVKKLRWQAPQPLKPTNKTFDAKKFGLSPFQTAMKIETPIEDDEDTAQDENCLTLNIWTRGDGKNKPVMVWIYGGACVTGYSSEPNNNGSKFAAAQDVVIVNFNYRLNIFGFLNLSGVDSSYEDSGYLGTKDQVAALKWVKENISAFGGDPDNITVFGESAGSISTMLLTVIPEAKGLFGKIISQSGHVAFYNDPETSARFAEKFVAACGAKKIGDLMKKSGAELKNLYKQFRDSNKGTNLGHFMPTADGKFLPRDPVQALKDGAARGIKFLTGTTADEWRAFLMGAENFFDIYRADPGDISPVFKRYKAKPSEEIYRAWLKNRPDDLDNYANFATQVDWRVGQELVSEYQSKFNDVYFYVFTQQAPYEILGACHALDIPYTFNVPYIEPNPDQNLVRAIQTSWAAFAATGNPDNKTIPHWERYTTANRQTMELNSKGCVCHKDLNTSNLNALRYVYES